MKKFGIAALLVLVVALESSGHAATFTNAVLGSDYATSSNWSPAAVPTGANDALIGGAGETRSAIYSTNPSFTARNLYIGDGVGANGTLMLQGSAGTLTFNGGTFPNGVYVGRNSGTGSLVIQAGTLASSGGDITLASAGTATSGALTVSGGAATSSRLILADAANSSAIVTLTSGSLTTGSVIYGGGSASGASSGVIHLNGGTLTATSFAEFVTSVASTLNFNGGTLRPSANSGGFISVNTANVRNGGALIDTNGFNITVAQVLQHSAIGGDAAIDGGLTKSGAGTLTLGGLNTYTGNVLISTGTLATSGSNNSTANGLGANTAGKTVTVASGATLISTTSDSASYGSTTVNNLAFFINGTWDNNPNNTAGVGFQRTDNLTLNAATVNDRGQAAGSFGGILMNGSIVVTGSAASTYNQLGAGSGLGILNSTFNVADVTGNSNADFIVNGLMRNTAVGTGNLTKTGGGTMVLNGAHSYTGTTTVNGGVLNFASGGLTNGGALTIGDNATGTLRMDGTVGTLNFTAANSNIGRNAGNGALVVDTGVFNTATRDIIVATVGTGTIGAVNVGGGAIASTTGRLIVADALNANATVNLTSGAITTASLIFGGGTTAATSATGTMNLDGGTLSLGSVSEFSTAVNSRFRFNGGVLVPTTNSGSFMQGLNTAEIRNGGAAINTNNFNITIAQALVHSTLGGDAAIDGGLTKSGAGTLTLGGLNTYTGNVLISTGTLATSGSNNSTANGLGANTAGKTVTVASGATLISTTSDSASYGSTTVNNLAFFINGTWDNNPNNTAGVGFQRTDNLTLNAATVNDRGQAAGSFGGILMNGSIVVTGSAASTYNQLGAGSGLGLLNSTFNVADVTGNSNADFIVNGLMRNTAVGTGNLTKTGGGTMVLNGASSYTGATTINAGVLSVADVAANGTDSHLGAGTSLVFGGGTLAFTAAGADSTNRAVTINAGGAGISVTDAAGNLSLTGVLAGAGGLTKSGDGRLTLTNTNTYNGATSVSDGVLLINGSLSSGGGAVTVMSGGTLGGSGTINRAVTVNAGGTLAPGNSPDQIFTGALTLAPMSTYAVELLGTSIGNGVSGYDQTVVTGAVALNGALLSILTVSGVGVGDMFTIIDNDGFDAVTGIFAGLAEGVEFAQGSFYYTISYAGGVNNNDVVLTITAIVPEPGSLTLCGLALLGGVFAVWRNRPRRIV